MDSNPAQGDFFCKTLTQFKCDYLWCTKSGVLSYTVYIDYCIENATYRFLFTSCKTLENFSKVLQRVNKNWYKALPML